RPAASRRGRGPAPQTNSFCRRRSMHPPRTTKARRATERRFVRRIPPQTKLRRHAESKTQEFHSWINIRDREKNAIFRSPPMRSCDRRNHCVESGLSVVALAVDKKRRRAVDTCACSALEVLAHSRQMRVALNVGHQAFSIEAQGGRVLGEVLVF